MRCGHASGQRPGAFGVAPESESGHRMRLLKQLCKFRVCPGGSAVLRQGLFAQAHIQCRAGGADCPSGGHRENKKETGEKISGKAQRRILEQPPAGQKRGQKAGGGRPEGGPIWAGLPGKAGHPAGLGESGCGELQKGHCPL